MNADQFCWWLQGFTELNDKKPPTPEQWQSIHEHLQLVFTKVTPPLGFGGGMPILTPGAPIPPLPRAVC